jgi:PAS domain S-box-containing protein
MSKRKDQGQSKKIISLRQHAEEVVRGKQQEELDRLADLPELSPDEARRLIHELQVHQIELETQNEELRQAQQQIEASRDKYADLYDFAPFGYFTVDKKGLIREVNLTGADLLGMERSALLKKPLSRFVARDSQDRYHFHRQQVFENKTRQTAELKLVKKDGAEFYAQLGSIALQDSAVTSGSRIRTVVTDVTKRKQADDVLRESEARYRSLFEDSPISIWEEDFSEIKTYLDRLRREGIKDFRAYFEKNPETVMECVPKVKVLDVNQATLELYQAERKEELLGDLSQLFTEHAFDMFQEELIALAEGKTRFKGEVTAKTLRDEEIQIDLSLSVAPGHEPTWAKVLVSIIDITERKQAEQALTEERNLLRTLIDNLPDCIFVKDNESRFIIGNTAVAHLMGATTPDELVGRTDFDFYPHELAAQFHADEETVIRSGQPLLDREELVMDSAGNMRWHSTIKAPLRNSQGKIVGTVGMSRNITERKQAEEEKAELLEAVSQQSEQLRALTARLAEAQEAERKQLARELHDQVGQNLTALGLNLNIIRTQLADALSAADPIYDRLDDSLILVEEVTERIRDVMTNLRPPVLDDYGLVAALRWYGDRLAAWTGLTITVQGEEPDPRLPTPVENALFRAAQEALTNAAKHAQATRVTVSVAVDNGTLRLIVADDGVGFEPAGPAEFARRQSWGLLNITERVEAVGGHCHIESRGGQGAQIIVELTRRAGQERFGGSRSDSSLATLN